MKKVKLEILKPWIVQQVVHYMQAEDDVLIGLIFNLLETAQFPDPRKMQVQLTGFLERNTKTLMLDLWRLMLSAQSNELGIPEEFLEQKKRELMEQQVYPAFVCRHARIFLAPTRALHILLATMMFNIILIPEFSTHRTRKPRLLRAFDSKWSAVASCPLPAAAARPCFSRRR
jgi:hypothetical protein